MSKRVCADSVDEGTAVKALVSLGRARVFLSPISETGRGPVIFAPGLRDVWRNTISALLDDSDLRALNATCARFRSLFFPVLVSRARAYVRSIAPTTPQKQQQLDDQSCLDVLNFMATKPIKMYKAPGGKAFMLSTSGFERFGIFSMQKEVWENAVTPYQTADLMSAALRKYGSVQGMCARRRHLANAKSARAEKQRTIAAANSEWKRTATTSEELFNGYLKQHGFGTWKELKVRGGGGGDTVATRTIDGILSTHGPDSPECKRVITTVIQHMLKKSAK